MAAHLTPSEVVRTIFGGTEAVAKLCGLGANTVYRWIRPSRDRDAGDLTSPRHMRTLLQHSRQHNLGLTADHLIFGATRAEVDAILAARAAATGAAPEAA